jgi:hypothetical protein
VAESQLAILRGEIQCKEVFLHTEAFRYEGPNGGG